MTRIAQRLEVLEAAAYRRLLERYAGAAGSTVAEFEVRADRFNALIRDHGWDRALEMLADEYGIDAEVLRSEYGRVRRERAEGIRPWQR